jgi:hypothetical protein
LLVGTRITDLPALLGSLADTDLLEVVDVSDVSVAPTGASKAVTVAQLRAAFALRLKGPVRCIVTTPMTLATGLVAAATVDGVVMAAGTRVLIAGQADTAANGIYVVQASGAPVRSDDFAVGSPCAGALVPVEAGSRPDSLWICVADTGADTVGTHPTNFASVTGSAPPFNDTVALLRDTARPTALLRFSLASLTAGQTRVITAPDRDLNLATPTFDSVATTGLTATTGTIGTATLTTAAAGQLTVGAPGTTWAFGTDGVATARGSVPATRAPAVAAGTATLDWRASSAWDVALDTTATIAFTQAQTGQMIDIRISRVAAGTTQATWSQTIDWAGGAAPTLPETANAWMHVWVQRTATGYEGFYGAGGGEGNTTSLRYRLLDYGVGASQFELDARFADYFDLRLSPSANSLANTIDIADAQVGQQFLLRLAVTSGTAPTTPITRLTWAPTVTWLGDVEPPAPNNPASGAGAPGPVVWVMLVCTGTDAYDGRFVIAQGGSGAGSLADTDNIANATSMRPVINTTTGVPTGAAGTLSEVLAALNAGGSTVGAFTVNTGDVLSVDARAHSLLFITYNGLSGSASLIIQNPRVGQRIRVRFSYAEANQTGVAATLFLRAPGGNPNALVLRRVGHAPTLASSSTSHYALVSPHNVPFHDLANGLGSVSTATWVELLFVAFDRFSQQHWDIFPTADRLLSGGDIRHGSNVPVSITASVADALNYLRTNGSGGGGAVSALAGLGLQFETPIRTRSFTMQIGVMARIAMRAEIINGSGLAQANALALCSVVAALPATAAIGDRCGLMIVDHSITNSVLASDRDQHTTGWSVRVSFADSEIIGAFGGVGGSIVSPGRMIFYKDPVLLGPGQCRAETNPSQIPGLPFPRIDDYYIQNTPETWGLKFPGEYLIFRYDRVDQETQHYYGGTNGNIGFAVQGWVLEHWSREPIGGRVGAPTNSYAADLSVPEYAYGPSLTWNQAESTRGWVRFGESSLNAALSTNDFYPDRTVNVRDETGQTIAQPPVAYALIPWAPGGTALRVRYCVQYAYSHTGGNVAPVMEFEPRWTTGRGLGFSFTSVLPGYDSTQTPTQRSDGLGLRDRRVTATVYGNVTHVRHEEEWVVLAPTTAQADTVRGLRPGDYENSLTGELHPPHNVADPLPTPNPVRKQARKKSAFGAGGAAYDTITIANNTSGTNFSPDTYWQFDVGGVPLLGIGIRYRVLNGGSLGGQPPMFIGMGRVAAGGTQHPMEPSPSAFFMPVTYLECTEENAASASVTSTSEIVQQELPALAGTGVVVYAETSETWGTRAVVGVTDQTVVTNGNGELNAPITVGVASTYAGQTSINTLGTIATGTWQGTVIGRAYGGTGVSTAPAAGQLLIGTGAGAFALGSIQGVTNRTTISVAADLPVVDIASTYAGQNTITTLGTIATGTWQGTTLAPAYGGTGSTAVPTVGQLAYCSSAGVYGTGAVTASATPGLAVTADGSGYVVGLSQGLATTSTPTFASVTLTDAPTAGTHAATKAYVDSVTQGLNLKQSCRVATTANIVTLSGLLTIDGVTVANGDRVLVKDQTTAAQNGIWVAAAGAWTRATDADDGTKLTSGAYCFVSEGTANAGTSWVLTAANPIVVGTTALPWELYSGEDQLTVDGTTIQLNTGVLQIASGYVGQVSITTLGTITTGTWQGTTIAVARGGTGTTTAPTVGQVPAGVTGGNYAPTSITGTANRVTVALGSGSIALSGPQDIHSAATPTFAGLTVNGVVAATGNVTSGAAMTATGTVSGAALTATSGVVTVPVGAVGAPSVTFAGRTTTGLYSPAAGKVSVAAGGVLSGTFVNGKLGLGTDAPSAVLSIGGAGIDDPNVPLQLVTPALGERWVGVSKAGGDYGLLVGYNNTQAEIRQAHATDPLIIRTGGVVEAASFMSNGSMIVGNSVSGGGKGNGTINCNQVWLNGNRLRHSTAAHVRLSASSSAVELSNVSTQTVILHPYGGNQIGLWNGSETVAVPIVSPITLSTIGYTSSVVYDVFVRLNAGVLELTALHWTDGNTRQAGSLTTVDGYWVRTSDTTQRYVGSFYYGGAVTDTTGMRQLWSYYNRVAKEVRMSDTTNHNYTTGTWRQWNNLGTNYVEWLCGMVEDAVRLELTGEFIGTTGAPARLSLGLGRPATDPYPYWGGLVATSQMGATQVLTLQRGTQQPLGRQQAHVMQYGNTGASYIRYEITGSITG